MLIQTHFSEESALECRQAILIYEGGEGALATVNPVSRHPQTDRAFIGAGRPATRSEFSALAHRVAGTHIQKNSLELLPECLLAKSEDSMVWYRAGQMRRLFVQTGDKTFNAQVNGRTVPHPALLFVANARAAAMRGLYVFSLDSDERPTPETPLFRAPYLNIYGAGNLCEGSFRLPEEVRVPEIEEWERAFFETHFSHTNVAGHELCAHPHGHHAMWRELARLTLIRAILKSKRLCEFPTRYLKPMSKPATLSEVLGT